MANLRVKIKVPKQEGAFKRFFNILTKRAQNNLDTQGLRDIVAATSNVIKENATLFIPNENQAAELGIGKSGKFDQRKIKNAWEALLPNSAAGATTVTIKRGRRSIRSFSINIDFDKLFAAPASRIQILDGEILWMKWFIEGATVSGHRFSGRQPVPETSRTGAGVMISGGVWTFPPQPGIINRLQKELINKLNLVARQIGIRAITRRG
jgi:hypothetical protein